MSGTVFAQRRVRDLQSWIRVPPRSLVAAWILVTALALVPIWSARVLPMLDVPNHLAQIRAWHSFSDPRYRIADYFVLRIHVVPYMLYHSIVNLLMYVAPIEVANRIAISLYVVLFPLSLLALARALHRSAWLALLGTAFVYTPCFVYGFVSYLLATPLMLFGVAAVIRFLDEGEPSRLAAICLCATGALLGHVLPWMLLGIISIGLCILDLPRLKRTAAVALALLPSLALAIFTFRSEQHDSSFVQARVAVDGTWRDSGALVREFPARVMDLFPGPLDTIVLAAVAAALLALLVSSGTAASDPRRMARRRLLVIIGVILSAYRALPFALEHPVRWWFVAPRMPPLVASLALLLPATTFVRARERAMMAVALAAIGLLMFQLTRLYRDFAWRNRGFFALIAKTERGKSTMVAPAGLWHSPTPGEASGDPASSVPVYWHWTEWPMALKGGFSPYIFAVGFPIVPKPGLQVQAPTFGDWDDFTPNKAPRFDYYLVQHPTLFMSGSDCCEVVDAKGSWVLFRRVR